jgi:hypothetical protein
LLTVRFHEHRGFASASAAQLWYEWKCRGLAVPLYVGTVMLFICGMLVVVRGPESVMLEPILDLLLLLPAVLAGAAGPALARFKPFGTREDGVITFTATRPLSSSGIVFAKFHMAALSAVLVWLMTMSFVVIWIVLSDHIVEATKLARDLIGTHGPVRMIAAITLASVLMPAWIWKQTTDGFAPVLTGRRWIAATPTCVYTTGIFVLIALGYVAEFHPEMWPSILWMLGQAVLLGASVKGALAIVVFRSVLYRRLMTVRAVAGVVALWLILTCCGIALATLLVPVPVQSALIWPSMLAAIAVFVPLVRFPLATLALEWNRHR